MIIFHGWKETNVCVKLNQSRKLLIPSVWSNQSGKTDNSLMFSLWRGTRSLQLPHDHHILPSHHRHTSPVPPLHYQGGPGIRESRHLQTGPASVRRSPGAGSLLCHPLCGCLREDWSENINLWDPPPRGDITKFVKPDLPWPLSTLDRSWPRTASRCSWTPSCTTRWGTRHALSPTWTTTAGPPDCWPPPPWGNERKRERKEF